MSRAATLLPLALAVVVATHACSAIPRDTNGALDRARNGVLRVGVVAHAPWTIVSDDAVRGVEAQLIEKWAASLGARVQWAVGDIHELVSGLHDREIDVLVGGLTQKTPYGPQLALTQPYVEHEDGSGETQARVIAVTPGESALLFSLDKFLSAQDRPAILATAQTFTAKHQP